LPRYEEWKKTANEMGLIEVNNLKPPMVVGDYRNHHIRIHHGTYGEDNETHYYVEFLNPSSIMMHIWRRRVFSDRMDYRATELGLKDISIGDPEFSGEIMVKGNKENDVKAILDLSIRDKINILLPTGVFNNSIIEVGCLYEYSTQGSSHNVEELGLTHYFDKRTFSETKGDAKRFRLIIDALIDIVEKIETYTPS